MPHTTRIVLCLMLLSVALALPASPPSLFHTKKPSANVERLRGGTGLDATQVAFLRVAPTLGCFIGNAMCISPLRKVLEVRKTHELGELNSLVYTALAANNFGWLLYGFVAKDPFILLTSITQGALALFYTLSCYPYGSSDEKSKTRKLFYAYTFTFVASILAAFGSGGNEKLIIGLCANAVLISYYSMPAAVLAKVCKQKNSESIDPLLTFIGFFHAALWTVYGYGVDDVMLLVSNGSSSLLQLVFLVVYVMYKPKPGHTGTKVTNLKRSGKGGKIDLSAVNTPTQPKDTSRKTEEKKKGWFGK